MFKENLNVLILAGGFGSRLKTLFPNIPKPLVPVQGKPFIFYILEQLNNFCIKNVTISTGYLASRIQETVGNNYKNLKVFYSHEKTPMGTGGAVKLVKFREPKDFCLVLNGDSFVNFNLNKLFSEHKNRNSNITIILNKVKMRSRFGSVSLDSNKKIISFSEKEQSKKEGYVNAGVYLFNSSVIESMESGKYFSLEIDFFPKQIGLGLNGFKCIEKFIDIGTPLSFYRATTHKFFD